MLHALLSILLASFLLVSSEVDTTCQTSYSPGPFTWTSGGVSQNSYLIQAGGTNSWGSVAPSASTITIGEGPRFYLSGACESAFSPTVFEPLNLLGATITFTLDLSNVDCGCDASFYLVGMPSGTAGTNGDYYCDANCVGGSCCTEMDLIEANKYAFQITAHMCTSLNGGCDADGCDINSQSITNGYGPGTGYTINSNNAFTVSITFYETSSQLSSITSVISQGSKSITLTHTAALCGSGYLQGLTNAFTLGVVPVWSFWMGSMGWLDSPACGSSQPTCSSSASFTFSNLIVSNAGSIAAVTPSPVSTNTCGITGCTINSYWVEFTPPLSFTGTNPPATASIVCANKETYSCTWGTTKYGCKITDGVACSNPVPYFNGIQCPYAIAQADLVDTTTSDDSADTGLIVGVVAGVCVIVVLIVILVVFVRRRNSMETV